MKMEPTIVHSVECTFHPRPFLQEKEERRTYVFGNSLRKGAEQVLLAAEPQLPSVIVAMIINDSHPSPDSFVRRSWVNKALGVTNGRQRNVENRLRRQGVSAFIDFEKIFASIGPTGYGLITCMKINATQVKRPGKNFSRTITLKFETTFRTEWNGKESFTRKGEFCINNWALLSSHADAHPPFGL